MLLELRAENYAVIDRAEARFGRGLNLLTGETGAGKSILIDALALLLGGKASADGVRHGAEKAVVSCVFEATPGALAVLEENGIDADGDAEPILLRREIVVSGKGRVFVNNQAATVGVLRLLAPELALCACAGRDAGQLRPGAAARVAGPLWRCSQARRSRRQYAGLGVPTETKSAQSCRADEQDRLRMADMWRFQVREIEQAGIAGPEEDAELETERRVLANAERLQAAALGAYEALYEGERQQPRRRWGRR